MLENLEKEMFSLVIVVSERRRRSHRASERAVDLRVKTNNQERIRQERKPDSSVHKRYIFALNQSD